MCWHYRYGTSTIERETIWIKIRSICKHYASIFRGCPIVNYWKFQEKKSGEYEKSQANMQKCMVMQFS